MWMRLGRWRWLGPAFVLLLACMIVPPPSAVAGRPFASSSPSSGHLLIVDGIQLSPSNPRVGQTVTATFRLRNETDHTVTMRRLRAGGRGPNACALNWDGPNADFPPVENLTLRPGQEYLYRQSRTFSTPGDYFAEPVLQDMQGRWGGIRPFPRVWFNVVDARGYLPPPECLIVSEGPTLSRTAVNTGEIVEVRMTLRNNGWQPLTIRQLVGAVRGPGGPERGWDAPEADFPAATDLVLAPAQEYTYRQHRAFGLPGAYFVEPAYMSADGKWGGIWPWPRRTFTVSCPALALGVQRCRGEDYELIIADLARPGVRVHVVTAHNWTDPEVFQAQTVRAMIEDPAVKPDCRVVAAINGGYFGPGKHNSEGWTVADGEVRRDMRAKVQADPDYPPQHWPSLVITPHGQARIGRYLWRTTSAREAITAGPIFIEEGRVLSLSDAAACRDQRLPEKYCRESFSQSAVAVDRDGRRLYLLATQPRTLSQVAELLGPRGLDVRAAMKLDGSSSAQMVYRVDRPLQSYTPTGGGGMVTDAILVCAP